MPEIKLTITLKPNPNKPGEQAMSIDGPVDNWPLCYDLLDHAKELVKQHHRQISAVGLVAAPAGALRQLDQLASNGR